MNNITFGQNDWGYYETVAGGAGAVNSKLIEFIMNIIIFLKHN